MIDHPAYGVDHVDVAARIDRDVRDVVGVKAFQFQWPSSNLGPCLIKLDQRFETGVAHIHMAVGCDSHSKGVVELDL